MSHKAVHPFPARMAPEIAEQAVSKLPARAVILDPMMGSGTFPIAALNSGRRAIGLDADPLAIVIATTAAGLFDPIAFAEAAERVVGRAHTIQPGLPEDLDTIDFIRFWFDDMAADQLGRLAAAIATEPGSLQPPLWCAFSRLIITKDAGASRARDAAHSRPHRVRAAATIDPLERYLESARVVLGRIPIRDPGPPEASFCLGDARELALPDASVDAVMTSPPYLSAIDYVRGHRLSLVWMGYTVRELRALRANAVGAERAPDDADSTALADEKDLPLSNRARGVLRRYASDLAGLAAESVRVVKPGGSITWVLADASLEGTRIPIGHLAETVLTRAGATLSARVTRAIPSGSRYLPPPDSTSTALRARMREESILTFAV